VVLLGRLGSHLRANAVAYLALFVALGTSGALAAQLAKKSVGTPQLKKNAVVSSKVKDRSLKAVDFADGQLPAGKPGEAGAQGPVGPTEGFAAAELAGAIPSATPESGIMERKIATHSNGRLFAFARGTIFVSCSAGTEAQLGIYLDGKAVTASGETIKISTFASVSVFGLSEAVVAGEHTLTLKFDCKSGTSGGASIGGGSAIGAILLGS
jgi:hypothetical protein